MILESCGVVSPDKGLIIPQRAGHTAVALFGAVGVLIGLASLSMVALQHPDGKGRTGPKFSRVSFLFSRSPSMNMDGPQEIVFC